MYLQKKMIYRKFLLTISLFLSITLASDNQEKSGFMIGYILGAPENNFSKKIDKINESNHAIYLEKFDSNYFSSFYIYNSELHVDQLYLQKQFSKNKLGNFKFKLGKLSHNFSNIENSLSSGSMIDSGNAFGIPRYLIELTNSYKNINFYFSLSDGILDKNTINLKRPLIHDKRLYINYNSFSIGFVHNVIWAGEVKDYGKQPNGLDDYFRVFLGRGGGADSVITDQPNALGDAFGMWDFSFKKNIKSAEIKLYHQTYFEDKSGLQFTNRMSQFDGLSGLSLNYKSTNLLFERLKTTFQGGNIHPPGIDSYYWNGIYRNGWQFKERIIGNIFLAPDKNRVKVIHVGISTIINENKFKFFYSDIKKYNISYNGFPPSEIIDLSDDFFDNEIQKNIYYERKINKMDIGLMIEHNQINTNIYFKVNYHL